MEHLVKVLKFTPYEVHGLTDAIEPEESPEVESDLWDIPEQDS